MISLIAGTPCRSLLRGASLLVMVVSFCSCSSTSVRPFQPITSMENFCTHGEPTSPSIMSIMSSISDTPEGLKPLEPQKVIMHIRKVGGVIAHWDDLNLLLPNTARALGEPDQYIRVRAAAIDNPPGDAQSRMLALRVRRKGHEHWYRFRAFDVQNACVVGSRQN